ncbi:S-type anion channel SLAH1 [Acorus calamus]|uniref:S-type anion channel SLAH1 n=1 Tax=Acorus calamus TaxID=4465 RepID=A0AAV9DQB2_ACOCL|nr:S-type anion channel SLAH1 [Acorus calamus]
MEKEKPQQVQISSTTAATITASKRRLCLSPLTKFHAGYFRISLSLCGQALLWKTLSETSRELSHPLHRLLCHFPSTAFILLWSLALLTLIIFSLLYTLRCLLNFQSVRFEFSHHVGVNYLFAPWISWLLLLQSSPFLKPKTTSYLLLWWAFSIPVVALDVKIYGQWFTKGKRFLSMVANPTSQLSVIGNLRLQGNDRLPTLLRPVFFLFVAAPSMASLAWDSIAGTFDMLSKMLFFLSLFIFASLMCRPALFRRSMKRFHVAWWAYSFPMTVLALASAEYARVVKGEITHWLMLILSMLSVLVALVLIVFSALNTNSLVPRHDPFVAHPMLPIANCSPSIA